MDREECSPTSSAKLKEFDDSLWTEDLARELRYAGLWHPFWTGREQLLEAKLTHLFAASNVPLSLIQDAKFQSLHSVLDPKFRFPTSRREMVRRVTKLSEAVNIELRQMMATAIIAVVLDIWSMHSMRRSYLGICAKVWGHDGTILTVVLMNQEFPFQHTGARIRAELDCVLEAWGIPPDNVVRFVTDGGSNIIAALKDLRAVTDVEEDETTELATLIDTLEDETQYQDMGLEREQSEVEEESGPQEDFQCVAKRVGCICHLLNCVCTAAQNTDPDYKELSSDILNFQGRFNKSTKMTGELMAASGGLKLASHCPTRWLGLVPVLQRLLRLKDAVIRVCATNKWNIAFGWDQVEDAVKLLLPWFQTVATLSADKTPTINLVVAECLSLVDKTEDYLANNHHFQLFANALINDLKRRLSGAVFNIRMDEPVPEPIYLIGALLDPFTAPALDDRTFDTAKEELVRYLRSKCPPKYKDDDVIFAVDDDVVIEEGAAPIPGLKRRREPRVSQGVHVERRAAVQTVVNPAHVNYLKAVSCYIRFLEAQQVDPIEAALPNRVWQFWSSTKDFQILRDVALAALVVPASSTAAERVFSVAGHLTGGRNGQLSPEVLNSKLTLRVNADALKSIMNHCA